MTIEYSDWRRIVDMRVFERLQMTVEYPEEKYLQNYQNNLAPSEMADIVIKTFV
jgi:hypothetical protein